jgi:hypothetical protein
MPVDETPYTRRRANLTDRSGSLAAATTSQQLAPANAARVYLLILNLSADDLWINETAAANMDQPSIKLVSGQSIVFEDSFCPIGTINIIGGTLGQKFTAKEG